MEIKINITKTRFFLLLGAVFFLAGVVYVTGYGGTQPTVVGHSAGELGTDDYVDTSVNSLKVGTSDDRFNVDGVTPLVLEGPQQTGSGTIYSLLSGGSRNADGNAKLFDVRVLAAPEGITSVVFLTTRVIGSGGVPSLQLGSGGAPLLTLANGIANVDGTLTANAITAGIIQATSPIGAFSGVRYQSGGPVQTQPYLRPNHVAGGYTQILGSPCGGFWGVATSCACPTGTTARQTGSTGTGIGDSQYYLCTYN